MHRRGKNKIWQFSINGVRQSSGTSDKERAEKLRNEREREAWDRQNGFHIPTWDEACIDWLEKHQHLKSYVMQAITAKWWKPHLTGRKLNAIDAKLIHKVISEKRPIDMTKAVSANATANAYVYFVEKIIRSATNLKPKFDKYLELRGERWLPPQEWCTLIPECYDDLLDICTFALATGLREGNIIGFEWTWEHGDKAYLPPSVTKTDKPYGIPLNKTAQAVIERRRNAKVRHPKYVFTNRGKVWTCVMLLRALKRAVVAAKLEHMTFHTLRHTFASWLAQMGVSDAIRCRLGCWSTGGSASSRYVHFDVEGLRPFSEMLDTKIAQAASENVQGVDDKPQVA